MRTFKRCKRYYKEYRKVFDLDKVRGPSGLYLTEILSVKMNLQPRMRILDMGCGAGHSSILLAVDIYKEVVNSYE